MNQYIKQISSILADLRTDGEVLVSRWPAPVPFSPAEMGLKEDSEKISLPDGLDLLNIKHISERLPAVNCTIFEVIGSTNTEMLKVLDSHQINDLLYLAEFQYGGRGRRGRTWISPYARNLAISLGIETNLTIGSISSLSLVVGLSIARCLKSLGDFKVELKWPNDILVDGKKLAGILVELADKKDSRALVIGLGLNIEISDEERSKVDQPLTDSKTLGIRLSRSEFVCVLVRSMRVYLEKFFEQGFQPMVESYSELLAYRNRFCSLWVGEKIFAQGILEGVNEKGELMLRIDGRLSSYGVGEISLRPSETSF